MTLPGYGASPVAVGKILDDGVSSIPWLVFSILFSYETAVPTKQLIGLREGRNFCSNKMKLAQLLNCFFLSASDAYQNKVTERHLVSIFR